MPSFFKASSLRLGVAADAIALVASRRGGREQSLLAELPLDAAHAYPVALAAGLKTLFEGAAQLQARSPLTVVLADEVCRLWQVTPPPCPAACWPPCSMAPTRTACRWSRWRPSSSPASIATATH